MRVALIGNMNNCFFALMRYLRYLDIDAHLFMYLNEYAHFMPEKDTYQEDKYENYIHYISVASNGKGLILANKKKIKKELEGYDFFIGCGIAPALFVRLNYQLDIFVPYHDAFELTTHFKFQFRNIIKYPVRVYTVKKQIEGIKYHTTKIISSGVMRLTKDSITRLGVEDKIIRKYLMMTYNQEKVDRDAISIDSKYIEIMSNRDIVIFSHTRHHWRDLFDEGNKGLDRLIVGYSQFIKANPNVNPMLIFFEYGKDIDASKELIAKLGIEEFVEWFPLMARREILYLIDYSDIVVDALSGSMWGGVGFEGLSRGKIIMQNILQSDEEYYQEMGHELPFIMKANKAKDVEKHLNSFVKNRDFYNKKSQKNRDWFNKYAGIGLAREYKEIIEQLYSEKQR